MTHVSLCVRADGHNVTRFGIESGMRCVIAVLGTMFAFAALAPPAWAQQPTTECVNDRPARNLVSDADGFFAYGLESVVVRPADAGHEVLVDTAAFIAGELDTFYDSTATTVTLGQNTQASRVVVVDGDTAAPGRPSVFTLGGVPTLFLHWTTAQDDLAALIGTSLLGPPAESGEIRCALISASPSLGEPATDLAYVVDPATAARPSFSPSVGLLDSEPMSRWPFGAAAAAAFVTAGGVVLARRDKIWEQRFMANVAQEARERALDDTSTPSRLPRSIFVDNTEQISHDEAPAPTLSGREINLQATTAASSLTKTMAIAKMIQKVSSDDDDPVLTRDEFASAVNTEWSRHNNGGGNGAIASVQLSELDALRLRLGDDAAEALLRHVATTINAMARPLDVLGRASQNELAILMPDIDEAGARAFLDKITKKITSAAFHTQGERVLVTPATGFALLGDTDSSLDLVRAVERARSLSMMNLHIDPERWDDASVPLSDPKAASASIWYRAKKKLRTPVQIAITVVISWVLPFFFYLGMDAIGLDISFAIYLFVVASLVLTGAFILAEGFMALKQKEPPETPTVPYPKATALIAAYMPNEADTVIETIESFLAIDYPNDLQIILAYNTPDPLPIEAELDRIAAKHPNFVPVRIVGSTSKAQNVNAALSMANGEFIGMFDADHQPRPDAFTRAWRWIDDGYDVVQGHCLTRNGDDGWLAKMIAVEFESIYAVAHPGRAKMHRFGVFGGSNGFWRTELLHETRMRGSMLTEDIDSSMRVVERGFKIRSDRDLVSRELATTTFKQVWNQRMRWAQGWFQVSLEHMKFAFRAKEMTLRQKLGIVHLLMWREVYPWLSQQLFPLIAFWAIRAGGIDKLDWAVPIFVATSLFTFSVGPLQTLFAYKLADHEIKQHKSWFWGYLLFTTPFYTEYKNLIARVAHVKQFMGESDWRVTPRSADPGPNVNS